MQVRCKLCGWEGLTNDLVFTHTYNPDRPGDPFPVQANCPNCGKESGLDDSEEVEDEQCKSEG